MTRTLIDSEVEWIGQVPVDWELNRIGSLFHNRVEKVSDYDFEPLSVTKNGIFPQLANVAKSDNHNDRKKVCAGDFVINSRSDRKMSSGVSPIDGSVSLINLVLYGDKITPEYANYLLKNYGFAEEFYRWGTGIVADLWSTNFERMKRIVVPYPSKQEQVRIAQFLDLKNIQINSIIEDTRNSIEEFKKYKQSLIYEMATRGLNAEIEHKISGIDWLDRIPSNWTEAKIKSICTMKSGKNLISEVIEESIESAGYPVYGGNGLRGYFHEFNQEGNYILIGRQGALCGNIKLVSGKFWATEHAVVTKLKINGDINYFSYLFEAMNLNQYSESAAQPGLAVGRIENLKTCVPPLEEQGKIAGVLDEKCAHIDSLIEQKQQLLVELEFYKKSLIYEYVTGKKEVL